MPTITSAGAGSGIDLESVISSSVAARKAQLQQPITTKKALTQTTLSGLGQLKSAISSFTTILDKLAEKGAFNKRAVTVTQDKDNPILKVETKSDASNGQYNITVNKLATTSRQEGIFANSTSELATADGQLTFKAGDKEFTVDVKAGDTLQSIRKRINSNGDNFGLSANIVNTADGQAKLVLDSGVSGDGKNLIVTASTAELKIFETGAAESKMSQTQAASSAEINVDGSVLKSDTNTFEDSVQDLKITVLRQSDKDTDGVTLKSNKVDISTDKTAIQDLVKQFIDGYNALLDRSTSLGKRNTIVAGESQDDGGALAGDSVTRTVKDLMVGGITEKSALSTTFSSIFEVGIKMDNRGKLSLDNTKFTNALDSNFDQVVALFGGDTGVAGKLTSQLKDYTKSGGVLGQREDLLNTDLRSVATRQTDVNAQLVKYEAALRQRYGNLDALLVRMNQSTASLATLTSQS